MEVLAMRLPRGSMRSSQLRCELRHVAVERVVVKESIPDAQHTRQLSTEEAGSVAKQVDQRTGVDYLALLPQQFVISQRIVDQEKLLGTFSSVRRRSVAETGARSSGRPGNRAGGTCGTMSRSLT
jgi:hypothetical protein